MSVMQGHENWSGADERKDNKAKEKTCHQSRAVGGNIPRNSRAELAAYGEYW